MKFARLLLPEMDRPTLVWWKESIDASWIKYRLMDEPLSASPWDPCIYMNFEMKIGNSLVDQVQIVINSGPTILWCTDFVWWQDFTIAGGACERALDRLDHERDMMAGGRMWIDQSAEFGGPW